MAERVQAKTEEARRAKEAEHRTRHIFWGSLVLSALIVVQIAYVAQKAGVIGTMQSLLPPVLLWSLVMTGYAFYTLSRIAERRAVDPPPFTDVNTGVFTLPYLTTWLEQERRHAVDTGEAAIVVYLDLVNLERVNSNAGHAVGDIVLKAVAQLVTSNVRSGDIVGRVGGDEFLVIMPGTTIAEARPVAAAVQEAVANYRLDLGKKGMVDFLRCKAGIAAFPAEGETPEDIMAAARERLK